MSQVLFKKVLFNSSSTTKLGISSLFGVHCKRYTSIKKQNIYTWGSGWKYTHGHETEEPVMVPTLLKHPALRNKEFISLSSGPNLTIAITIDKKVNHAN